jgi:hypothetical protein
MRDRLIELIQESDILCHTCGENSYSYCAEAIADYILADGWIRLPVKLNQILYKPYTYRNMIDECRVSSITQKANGTFKIRLTNLFYRAVFEVTIDDIGKTVFFTRKEAEQALKGE